MGVKSKHSLTLGGKIQILKRQDVKSKQLKLYGLKSKFWNFGYKIETPSNFMCIICNLPKKKTLTTHLQAAQVNSNKHN